MPSPAQRWFGFSRRSRSAALGCGLAALLLFTAFACEGFAQDVTVRIADWAQMPFSGNLTLTGSALTVNPAYMARVNFMREEPGAGRVWIVDLNGHLYILDKNGTAA